MFNLTVLLAPLLSSLSNVLQFVHVSNYATGLLPTMLLYFGILYPYNCGNIWRLYHSALLLILITHLPSPRISFTLNSKMFCLNNPFFLLHHLFSVLWPLDLANGFRLTVIFHSFVYFHLVHLRQCL